MPYEVKLNSAAEKSLSKIPEDFQQKIKAALASLKNNPYLGKKLAGKYKNYYSLRVWPYRIIYTIYKRELVIIVIAIGHRQGIY